MVWIMCFIAFIFGAISMFTLISIGYTTKAEEPVNKVKFYVAKDINGTIWLYMGKPKRTACTFISSGIGLTLPSGDFSKYGLDVNDYDNLKWEDEPVEVFINMEE